ncbi:hypothetical protein A3770_11p63770 [Chloropicon primus]|uniref:S phase cyclin A-associated protein in the endoplasmic reticulum N-terminal domain-containing protein n=1 Tax=Chloropicon primus TaxID=1764295 RepID=A0A5B8MTA7_9CHLO|nr:hypothetical protein A3770_11p63770 [Chloropicon primus]|eukprot:QDZ23859.1 hypothetical protein A3770_11p63770 [Chloropicon primus]
MGDKHRKGASGGNKGSAWSVVTGRRATRQQQQQLALKTNNAVVNGVAFESGGDNDNASENVKAQAKRGDDFNVLASFPIDLDVSSPAGRGDEVMVSESLFVTPVATSKAASASSRRRKGGASTGRRSSSQKSLSSKKLDIWNRLMNNLTRAIDDVYFMSEVECDSEQVMIVQKVIRNSMKDFESLASSIESQKHFEKEREEASKGSERKRMTVAWDVKKTIKVSPKHVELLSTLESDEDTSVEESSLDSETSFEGFLTREADENNGVNSESKAPAGGRKRAQSYDKPAKSKKEESDLAKPVKDGTSSRSNCAWREERNWGDIFANRARDLQAKLLSPDRQKLTPLEAKKRADEKQARASLLRKKRSRALAERLAKADETRQAIRSQQADKLEKKIQDMDQKIQRGRQLRDKHLAAIAGKAKSENMKVNEVIQITSLEAEDKRSALKERMQETEARRQEILAAVVERQRQTDAAIEEVQKRKQKLEEERLKLLAEEIQRKEQIQLKLQQERQQAAEAREALAKKQRMAAEENQRVQEHEAELIRKKIAGRLEEARTRRSLYLGQIKEKASLNKQDGERRDSGAFTSIPYLLSPAKDKKVPESPRIGENRESEYLQRHLEEFTSKIQHFSIPAPKAGARKKGGDDHLKKRFQKRMRDLKKHSSKNNVEGIHSLCMDTMHLLNSENDEHLNLARECGLVDYVLEGLSNRRESWPARTKLLLLRLLKVMTCNSTDTASYILSKDYFSEITNLLLLYTEADCFNPGQGSLHSNAVDILLPVMSKLLLVAQEKNLEDFESATGFFSCSGLLHQIRDSFSLFDPSKVKNDAIPTSIESCLRMLDAFSRCQETQIFDRASRLKASTRCLLAAFKDASMIGLPSLITTVLLHTSQTSEIDPSKFPRNFTTSAYFVVKILNNMAAHDYQSLQKIMGSADMKAESFHLLSSLLSYCTSLQATSMNHESSASKLLNEVILLVGNFVVLNPANQAVLHWGKSPTILEKLCQLPFNYFFTDELQKVLNPTLLAACFKNDRNREVTERNVSLKFVRVYLEKGKNKAEMDTKEVDRFALEHRFPLSLTQRAISWIGSSEEVKN